MLQSKPRQRPRKHTSGGSGSRGSILSTMSDDAPQPRPNFYTNFHRSFAKFTHFIDDHIRVIQYCVYGVGAAGILLSLHSVRAFTKFKAIQDIPKEFISKHVRLFGHVRWVGVSPPAKTTPSQIRALPKATVTDGSNESADSAAVTRLVSTLESESIRGPFSVNKVGDKESGKIRDKANSGSLSSDNRGIYEGAGELHPWEDGIDPDVDRIFYEEDLRNVYIQIEHSPVISLTKKKTQQYLPVQLADVEVSYPGLQHAKSELLGKRAWFTLLSHDNDTDTLVSIVKPSNFLRWRSLNEVLVRRGEALTGPMNMDLFEDRTYNKFYVRLVRAQEFAERKKIGMWKPQEQPPGMLKKLWTKMKELLGREP